MRKKKQHTFERNAIDSPDIDRNRSICQWYEFIYESVVFVDVRVAARTNKNPVL